MPTTFTNLDGLTVTTNESADHYIAYLKSQGYTREIALRGKVGWSELGLHTRKHEHVGIVAFVREDRQTYAYVILNDGSFLDGSFHLFESGEFSLS